jgi:hypothetical protein
LVDRSLSGDKAERMLPIILAFATIVPSTRIIGYLFEIESALGEFRDAEFNDWYNKLYGDRIVIDNNTFYIHYRPRTIYSILGLGVLTLPFFFLPEYPLFKPIASLTALFIDIKIGNLLIKRLLEIYAITAPRIINISLRLATPLPPQLEREEKMHFYFRRFYAKSRLTILIE